ncbi:hypothetical protein AK812_SmicGene18552 [Symbiodinium microadriaticum]|uniref:Uncharacterized protein n=1 Tax=Symbiodinium microadriaticum TaxID=2951 RepID=A0A1Q9DUT9_SYMMI|nr:hypothetical protein AK812_SmicGene18552 [Symbiodinium microadriaticum]
MSSEWSLPSTNDKIPDDLQESPDLVQKLFLELDSRIHVPSIEEAGSLCCGGRLQRKPNQWLREAYEASKIERVPHEKHIKQIVAALTSRYHLCDKRVNKTRWIQAEAEGTDMDNCETMPMDFEAVPPEPLDELDSDEMVGSGSEDLKSPSEDEPEPSDVDMKHESEEVANDDDREPDANDDDGSGEDDGSSDEDDEAFRATFQAMKPSAVANLLRAIESHELYPFYCEYREPEGKFSFGPEPVDDVLAWNSWLNKHGATVRTQLAATSAVAATSVGRGRMVPAEVPCESKEAASLDGEALSDSDSDSSGSLLKLVSAARGVELSSSDDSDREKANPALKRSLQIEASPKADDVERSKFTIGGVAALDVNRVQNAALEAVSKPVLTPQQQLEMLKNQRAKSKPKKTTTREEQKEGLAVYQSGWMKVKIQAAKAKNAKPKADKSDGDSPNRDVPDDSDVESESQCDA